MIYAAENSSTNSGNKKSKDLFKDKVYEDDNTRLLAQNLNFKPLSHPHLEKVLESLTKFCINYAIAQNRFFEKLIVSGAFFSLL